MTRIAPTLPALALAIAGCGPTRAATAPEPAPVTRATIPRYIDSLVSLPQFRNMHWGVLVVDPVAGDTLYAHNADKLFMPASNMKLVTGSVALDRLGPDFRFATTYLAAGTITDSTLVGHLLIEGTGDPSVSESMHDEDPLAPLRQVADSLRARGIVRIAGHLLPHGDAFSDAPYGYGWAWDDFDAAYSAGVDELFFNEGFTRIRVIGEADSTIVETHPVRNYPPATLRLTPPPYDSLANGCRRRPRLRAESDSLTGGVVVSGWIAPGDTFNTRIAYRDQRRAYIEALRQALAEGGITVADSSLEPLEGPDSLFTIHSPTLAEILPVFEKPSQNQIGEILFKTIAREATGAGRADTARRVIERHLTVWGIDTAGFAIRDGSGLSRHDYLSPRAIVQLLDVMRKHQHFKIFYDALPIAGVDGTIENRMRGTPAEGNIHAKTGTLDKARALSGYVTTADGRMLLFSMLANNYTVPTAEITRVQDLIGAQLATLRMDLR